MQTSSHLFTHFIEAGAGQPIVLVHGYAGSNRHWQHLVPELTAAGCQVFAPDLVGHGLSEKCPSSVYHIEAVYRHFANWMDSIAFSRPPILVGHSMGAYLSLNYALHTRRPVGGLFFVSPYFSQDQLTDPVRFSLRRHQVSKAVLRHAPEWTIRSALRFSEARADRLPRRIRRQLAEDFKRLDPEAINAPRTLPELHPRLDWIAAPTMVVWGESDTTLQPSGFPSVCEAIPHAWVRSLPGGHLPHLSHPATFNRAILEFLAHVREPLAPDDGRTYPAV